MEAKQISEVLSNVVTSLEQIQQGLSCVYDGFHQFCSHVSDLRADLMEDCSDTSLETPKAEKEEEESKVSLQNTSGLQTTNNKGTSSLDRTQPRPKEGSRVCKKGKTGRTPSAAELISDLSLSDLPEFTDYEDDDIVVIPEIPVSKKKKKKKKGNVFESESLNPITRLSSHQAAAGNHSGGRRHLKGSCVPHNQEEWLTQPRMRRSQFRPLLLQEYTYPRRCRVSANEKCLHCATLLSKNTRRGEASHWYKKH